jgi:SAM-dependent methyltransferase
MTDSAELQRQRERMRSDWERRARQDAEQYIYTRDRITDEADLDASGKVNFEQLVRPFLPVLLRGRPPRACRVVEIGCGIGRMTRVLAAAFLEVQAVDVSPEMIRRAKERLRDCSNVLLQVNSGTDLAGLESNRFDLVFSYLVFQHIPSRAVIENYLREAARVLKPAGAILFQLNGDWSGQDAQTPPDTWVGVRFSLAEAVKLLERTGFRPITATGAGTQYLLLAARKADLESALMPSFLLPGAAADPEQLLDGWEAPAADGYRPVAAVCRTRLAVPQGSERRLFLSTYFPPREAFPGVAFAVKLDDAVLASVRVERHGDHHFEWALPSDIATGPCVVVSLEFAGGPDSCLPWVRSMGIVASVGPEHSAGPLRWELEERLTWCRELEAHLGVGQRQLQDCRGAAGPSGNPLGGQQEPPTEDR